MSDDPRVDDPRVAVSKLTSPFLDLLPVTGVAISVLDEHRRSVMLHSTDSSAARLEELHFDLGEGPLFDAFASGSTVSVSDLSRTEQWPAFLRDTEKLDVGAIFVFPLMLGAVCLGGVICYRSTPGPLDPASSEIGRSLARAAAAPSLREAIVQATVESLADDAPGAWRRQVYQATGMMLVQLNITASDAFSRLRAYAFLHGCPVQDVANDVVARRLNFAELSE